MTAVSAGSKAASDAPRSDAGLVGPVNEAQVIAVLNDIDRSGDVALIDAVFKRWGYKCFHNRPTLKAFAEKQRLDFRGYLDYVNSGRAMAWERIDFDEASGVKNCWTKDGPLRPPVRAVRAAGESVVHPLLRGVQGRIFQIHDRSGGERSDRRCRPPRRGALQLHGAPAADLVFSRRSSTDVGESV